MKSIYHHRQYVLGWYHNSYRIRGRLTVNVNKTLLDNLFRMTRMSLTVIWISIKQYYQSSIRISCFCFVWSKMWERKIVYDLIWNTFKSVLAVNGDVKIKMRMHFLWCCCVASHILCSQKSFLWIRWKARECLELNWKIFSTFSFKIICGWTQTSCLNSSVSLIKLIALKLRLYLKTFQIGNFILFDKLFRMWKNKLSTSVVHRN